MSNGRSFWHVAHSVDKLPIGKRLVVVSTAESIYTTLIAYRTNANSLGVVSTLTVTTVTVNIIYRSVYYT